MNFIKTYKNTISEKDCSEIIEYYKNNEIDKAVKNKANLSYSVKEVCLNTSSNPFWKDKLNLIKKEADKNLREYLSFNIACGFDSYSFRYLTLMHHEEFFNIPYHFDSEIQSYNEGRLVRVFAILVYLNNNFEGGELIFPVQNEVVKPEPGLMTIFPTSFMYPHVTTPSIGSDRFVLRLNYFVNEETFIKN